MLLNNTKTDLDIVKKEPNTLKKEPLTLKKSLILKVN